MGLFNRKMEEGTHFGTVDNIHVVRATHTQFTVSLTRLDILYVDSSESNALKMMTFGVPDESHARFIRDGDWVTIRWEKYDWRYRVVTSCEIHEG